MEVLTLTIACHEGRPPADAIFAKSGCLQPVPARSAGPGPGPPEETRAPARAGRAAGHRDRGGDRGVAVGSPRSGSGLRRSIRRAQRHGLIGKNVVELVDLPKGQPGRPSRAMTQEQASKVLATSRRAATAGYVKVIRISEAKTSATHAATADNQVACGCKARKNAPATQISGRILDATCRLCRTQLSLDETTESSQRLDALFVLAFTLGLRPGELRALTWDHVDLDQCVIHVWHSARRDGDTKTPSSRRSLVLPRRAAEALRDHQKRQAAEQHAAGDAWRQANLVFCHQDGRPYSRDGLNWRFGKMTRRAGIGHWHAHEGRHTAVSIMSSNGVKIQDISDTVGHKSTHVTETVYRHVIVPAIRGAAAVMDDVFDDTSGEDDVGGEQDGSKTEDS
jgi:site-specific recombinase XerC